MMTLRRPSWTGAARLPGAARGVLLAYAATFAVTLVGCHHQAPPPVLPPASTAPVALETPPAPETPPTIAAVPAAPVVLPPQVTPTPPKRAVRKKPATPPKDAQPVPAAPPQVAAAEPSVAAIGALSAGGEANPQSRQEAADLIASIQKRLAGLPAKTADAERDQIKTVRNFLAEAQKALDSGDAAGAKTLATKAKLVMDDVEK